MKSTHDGWTEQLAIETQPMQIDNGGAAFPALYPRADEDGRMGMTLRDYFAAKAMQADIAASGFVYVSVRIDAKAKLAYQMADAMIRARQAA